MISSWLHLYTGFFSKSVKHPWNYRLFTSYLYYMPGNWDTSISGLEKTHTRDPQEPDLPLHVHWQDVPNPQVRWWCHHGFTTGKLTAGAPTSFTPKWTKPPWFCFMSFWASNLFPWTHGSMQFVETHLSSCFRTASSWLSASVATLKYQCRIIRVIMISNLTAILRRTRSADIL